MNTRSLPDEAPGEYKSYGKHPNYLPDKLPPDIDSLPTNELRTLIDEAILNLGQLKGIGEEASTNPMLYTTMIRREAVESILIEGGDINIEDLFEPSTVERSQTVETDVREALNYETTVQEGADRVAETGAITLELLKQLHTTLLKGARDEANEIGSFRKQPTYIPPPTSEEAPFYPPTPKQVPELMENLVGYIATGGQYHDLIDTGLVHYQFETIHPFGDGNGRLGRILITLQLIKNGYLKRPYLYPSEYFNRNKIEYVRKMRAVSEEGAWEPWLSFFIEGIRKQAADAVERTERLRELRRAYDREYGSEKTAADRLAMRLFQQPYLTATDAAEMLDVVPQTARNAIHELEASGVLEETTGKDRYREYKAVDIFEIMSASIE